MGDNPHQAHRYTISDDESLWVGVVNAVAEVVGCDPIELDPPLAEVVDPEALDSLFQPTQRGHRGDGRVEFEYHQSKVVVHSYGVIEVTPDELQMAISADD